MKNKFFDQDFAPDLYSRLGLLSTASEKEIKKAFRSLAQKNHPDKYPGDKDKETRFVAVNRAYEILSDSSARALYDGALERIGQPTFTSQHTAGQTNSQSKDDSDFEETLKRAYERAQNHTNPGPEDFEHPDFYKCYNYTPDEVEKYKAASSRLGTGHCRSGDLTTAFNFLAKDSERKGPARQKDPFPKYDM